MRSGNLAFWLFAAAVAALAILAATHPPARALTAPVASLPAGEAALHWAPAENLERLDVAALDDAVETIDVAAYVLTDHPLIGALEQAAARGVAVRLLLDRGQYEQLVLRGQNARLDALRTASGVVAKFKSGRALMHLKSYQIDGRLLRTGSANFSASGLKSQDNDLVMIASPAAAAAFKRQFDTVFAAGASQ